MHYRSVIPGVYGRSMTETRSKNFGRRFPTGAGQPLEKSWGIRPASINLDSSELKREGVTDLMTDKPKDQPKPWQPGGGQGKPGQQPNPPKK